MAHMGQSEPPEAPGRLGLVEEFVNSVELPDGDDQLGTADQARGWLSRHGVTAGSVDERDRARLVELREALRDLLEGNGEGAVSPRTVERVMRTFNGAELGTVISPEGAKLVATGSGVAGFIGELAAAMVSGTIDGTWQRLKVCRSEECRWAFYDRSKNACRTWCSMRVCGCRTKSRTYRARKREADAVA